MREGNAGVAGERGMRGGGGGVEQPVRPRKLTLLPPITERLARRAAAPRLRVDGVLERLAIVVDMGVVVAVPAGHAPSSRTLGEDLRRKLLAQVVGAWATRDGASRKAHALAATWAADTWGFDGARISTVVATVDGNIERVMVEVSVRIGGAS